MKCEICKKTTEFVSPYKRYEGYLCRECLEKIENEEHLHTQKARYILEYVCERFNKSTKFLKTDKGKEMLDDIESLI